MFCLEYKLKHPPPVSEQEFAEIQSCLTEAKDRSAEHIASIPVDTLTEHISQVRRKLKYVAENLDIPLAVTRKGNSLQLTFPSAVITGALSQRVLRYLQAQKTPRTIHEISDAVSAEAKPCYRAVSRLRADGLVDREGSNRHTRYFASHG